MSKSILNKVYKIVGVEIGQKLPNLAFPGMYQIIYLTRNNDCLCSDCANKHNDEYDPVVHAKLYQEGATIRCDGCNCDIESDYGDPGEDK